jgi:predicted esterase
MHNEIEFAFKARYYKSGEITEKTKSIWIVCHGYGQLASYFIRNFDCIANEEVIVIAPEGLSRFYLQGFSGRVGATWMTKEDRLTDIENYINYLEAIYNELNIQENRNNIKINLLGFSQGTATVCRFAMIKNIKFDTLILWAGKLPGDMSFNLINEKLEKKKLIIVYGEEDEFINPEEIQNMKKELNELKTEPNYIHYSGGHKIYEKPLLKVYKIVNS